MARHLVVDLAATSRNWALPADRAGQLRDATPPGWTATLIEAPTVSDGDGGSRPSDEARRAIGAAEVYFGFGISRPLFVEARELRWIHSAAAGVQGALFAELVASPVVLTNSAGVHAVPIAETVIAGVMMLLRSLDVAVALQRERRWDKEPWVGADSRVRELSECRVLVVGAGGLGSEIARRCSAFGARCTGVRRRPELGPPPGFERVVGPDALDAELPAADVLIVSAPSTERTAGLIDARRLDALPAGAIVANVGRGSLMDENAVAERARSGRLRGAVLDVFATEPLPATSPLWGLRNVVLTPHVSAVSPRRFWERELALFLDNWGRYERGEPLRNVVDKDAGY